MPILHDKEFKVHPQLKKYYHMARSRAPTCQTEYNKHADKECYLFVSCTPSHICEMPCENCLSWSGYGGQETIDALELKCKSEMEALMVIPDDKLREYFKQAKHLVKNKGKCNTNPTNACAKLCFMFEKHSLETTISTPKQCCPDMALRKAKAFIEIFKDWYDLLPESKEVDI